MQVIAFGKPAETCHKGLAPVLCACSAGGYSHTRGAANRKPFVQHYLTCKGVLVFAGRLSGLRRCK